MELILIIPCYNEAKRLPQGFPGVYEALQRVVADFEIVLVNDGSSDGTKQIIEDIQKQYPHVRSISYKRNRGKGFAIQQAVQTAHGEIIGFTDADFPIDLAYIKKVQSLLRTEKDIVIAERNKPLPGTTTSVSRRFFGELLTICNTVVLPLGTIRDTQCGFKFFRKDVAYELFSHLQTEGWLFDLELLLLARRKQYRIAILPVAYTNTSQSTVRLLKDFFPVIRDLVLLYARFAYKRLLFLCLILSVLLLYYTV